jgi:hypothetical protein
MRLVAAQGGKALPYRCSTFGFEAMPLWRSGRGVASPRKSK